jgi:hypothetical protein
MVNLDPQLDCLKLAEKMVGHSDKQIRAQAAIMRKNDKALRALIELQGILGPSIPGQTPKKLGYDEEGRVRRILDDLQANHEITLADWNSSKKLTAHYRYALTSSITSHMDLLHAAKREATMEMNYAHTDMTTMMKLGRTGLDERHDGGKSAFLKKQLPR